MIIDVVNRAWGISPATAPVGEAPLRAAAAGGRICVSQYGHTLSAELMKARQFGHIRLESTLIF
jgi:hypothetical protein